MAAVYGNEEVVALLSDASLGVDHESSVVSFVTAAAHDEVGVMRCLMQPPFCVGPADVDSWLLEKEISEAPEGSKSCTRCT
eukprot:m51a1_g3113 hypothetical protein (81) ;mRNA; r:158202-161138